MITVRPKLIYDWVMEYPDEWDVKEEGFLSSLSHKDKDIQIDQWTSPFNGDSINISINGVTSEQVLSNRRFVRMWNKVYHVKRIYKYHDSLNERK